MPYWYYKKAFIVGKPVFVALVVRHIEQYLQLS